MGGNIADGLGASAFNLDGGTLNLTGSSITLDNFNIGNAAGSNGNFTLGSGQTLGVATEIINGAGIGIFNQTGGAHTVSGTMTLAAASVGSTGTYNLSADSLSAASETIGGYGTGDFNQSGGTHTVSGTMALAVNAGSLGVYNLTGGTLNVGNIMSGAGGSAFNLAGGTLNLTGSSITLNAFNISNSSFTLGSGQTLTASNGITNNGITYTAAGIFSVGAGATATVGGPGFVNHGLLGGGGTIVGNVTSDGTVGPGNSPGTLSITGNYTQTKLGTYAVEIGGIVAVSQYDVLNVSGTATLDGLLNVSLFDLGGGLFAPHAGDYFDILTASAINGSFSSLSFTALSDPNLFWQITYLTDYIGITDVVRLSVAQHVAPPPAVPEPETYAMLLAGLGLLGFNARRRKSRSA